MSPSPKKIDVYLEIGSKRTFAGAVDWPGWCRSGRDEQSALQALLDYAPRYARMLRPAKLPFQLPDTPTAFKVVERLKGGATTDFGAPEAVASGDTKPIKGAELQRFEAILKAGWRAFDEAAEAAAGKTLRKGPRGGGRDLEGITRHVLESDAAYLSALGWKFKADEKGDAGVEKRRIRTAILEGLAASVAGEIPARGPRGGMRWSARYFVRRVAWHVLDHAWELEDRIL